ncbi:pentatricopeptide repeat-containing protein at1g62260 mitochondrial [Phtheirospermum japonicum]|uniref:Pentatricopeptide repeat-containing protein at1g62260 mitochondrial n=1 Tax=Phtheirospermum japonicum TaxID=374723 RepID=A0A830CFR4_9LAMI|nr:pentatricopeptide repeat-containing protein at1g62260 mitochondrial [Phtheirospermum japonicum]
MLSSLKSSLSQVPPEIRSANKKITELIRAGRLEDARTFFDQLSSRTTVTWNSMLSGYVKRREIAKARSLFDEMPEKDVVSWNLMVSGYVSCCGRRYVEEGRYLFDKMPGRDFISWNTMISGYAKNGKMDDALKLFDSMPEKNIVTWNAMITGFLNNGDVKSACELFNKMPRRDEASLSALVSGLIQNDECDEAEKVLLEYVKTGDTKTDSVHAFNTLIAGYGQKGRVTDARRIFDQAGDMTSAKELFDQMEKRDTVTWNTMISGCVHAFDIETALKLFSEMSNPDALSWNSIISGFAQAGKMEPALDFFERMPNKNRVSWNTIISGYARCGAISEAENVFFNEMGFRKDVISWNAMIGGYASHGLANEAIELFEKMKRLNVRPTYITFVSVLSACAHGGLVEEGKLYFKSMTCDFEIEPRVEHFASLVDVVGRCGRVEEAMDIIGRMPVEPDKAVWGALLGACRVHDNTELARVAAEELMRLEPESSGPYVLLYNMYVDAERWNDADRIRMLMDKKNIKKERGYSRVGSSCS